MTADADAATPDADRAADGSTAGPPGGPADADAAPVHVHVNGEAHPFDGALSVEGLVDALGLDRRGLALALNGEVVPRSTWADHGLADGDQIEILTIAQGG